MVDRQEPGGAPPEPDSALEVEKIGLERAVFFSDAVIAIAMTLLALDLEVPDTGSSADTWRSLGEHWHDSYFPFLLSFVVIATFWFSHHQFFGKVRRLGGRMIQVNMVFLLMMVLLPFVTRVLGAPGDADAGPVLYASVLALTCFALAFMGWTGSHYDLMRPDSRTTARWSSGCLTGLVFLVSIPIAFWNTSVAEWSWLVLSYLVHASPTDPGDPDAARELDAGHPGHATQLNSEEVAVRVENLSVRLQFLVGTRAVGLGDDQTVAADRDPAGAARRRTRQRPGEVRLR